MLRILSSIPKNVSSSLIASAKLVCKNGAERHKISQRNFSSLLSQKQPLPIVSLTSSLGQQVSLVNNPSNINYLQARTVTKYSIRKGKRKTVKTVLKRFYRLNWGIWIRTYCGRAKKLWKKSPPRKRRLRQHVFCNATQSRLLDKMVNAYWRRPRHYVEDPYEPYHTREEFKFTYRKPRPYFPPEQQ